MTVNAIFDVSKLVSTYSDFVLYYIIADIVLNWARVGNLDKIFV